MRSISFFLAPFSAGRFCVSDGQTQEGERYGGVRLTGRKPTNREARGKQETLETFTAVADW